MPRQRWMLPLFSGSVCQIKFRSGQIQKISLHLFSCRDGRISISLSSSCSGTVNKPSFCIRSYELNLLVPFLKIHPFVKGPVCYFCCNHIEGHDHADDQKDGHWQWFIPESQLFPENPCDSAKRVLRLLRFLKLKDGLGSTARGAS